METIKNPRAHDEMMSEQAVELIAVGNQCLET